MDVISYTGPAVWILAQHWRMQIAKMPEDAASCVNVAFTMTDGKMVKATVVADRLVELPEPYTCRDIKEVRKVYQL